MTWLLGLVGFGVALAGLAGLTLASEFVSFSSVIEKNSFLRAIDRAGRSEVI